jgi:hypothetical protein
MSHKKPIRILTDLQDAIRSMNMKHHIEPLVVIVDGMLYQRGQHDTSRLLRICNPIHSYRDSVAFKAARNAGHVTHAPSENVSKHEIICPCGETTFHLTYGMYDIAATCPSCGLSEVVHEG